MLEREEIKAIMHEVLAESAPALARLLGPELAPLIAAGIHAAEAAAANHPDVIKAQDQAVKTAAAANAAPTVANVAGAAAAAGNAKAIATATPAVQQVTAPAAQTGAANAAANAPAPAPAPVGATTAPPAAAA